MLNFQQYVFDFNVSVHYIAFMNMIDTLEKLEE